MENLADKLIEAIDSKQNPSCVGLDPRIKNIPEHIKRRAVREYGNTLEAVASAFVDFNTLIIDRIADIVPVVKPQAAFYEAYGAPGVAALGRTIKYAQSKGLLVITDAKRNDIKTTARAYANAWLGKTKLISGKSVPVFNTDMLTVNGYLGGDGINPFLEVCKEHGKGIFVLAKTSNPTSGELQDLVVEGEDEVFKVMAKSTKDWGANLIGKKGYSPVGMVVGATYAEQADKIREVNPTSIILVPGYGAQGGGAEGTMPNFNKDGYGALVNSSRDIIFAYQNEQYSKKYKLSDFHWAAREAAEDMRKDIVGALEKAGKLPGRWKK